MREQCRETGDEVRCSVHRYRTRVSIQVEFAITSEDGVLKRDNDAGEYCCREAITKDFHTDRGVEGLSFYIRK